MFAAAQPNNWAPSSTSVRRFRHSPYAVPVLHPCDMDVSTAAFLARNAAAACDSTRVSIESVASIGGGGGVADETRHSRFVPFPSCGSARRRSASDVGAPVSGCETPKTATPLAAAATTTTTTPACATKTSDNTTTATTTTIKNPPAIPKAARAPTSVSQGPAHTALSGRCEFLPLPDAAALAAMFGAPGVGRHAPLDAPSGAAGSFRLFFGRLRFEMTAAELRWLLREAGNAEAAAVEPSGAGCFVATFGTEDDVGRALALGGRLLCDRGGVWHARTATEQQALGAFVRDCLADADRGSRLPTSVVVVEEFKGLRCQRVATRRGRRGLPTAPSPVDAVP